jgi:hypothetical protein
MLPDGSLRPDRPGLVTVSSKAAVLPGPSRANSGEACCQNFGHAVPSGPLPNGPPLTECRADHIQRAGNVLRRFADMAVGARIKASSKQRLYRLGMMLQTDVVVQNATTEMLIS